MIAASCCVGPGRWWFGGGGGGGFVVECCCCIPYQLALMLVLTFAPSVLTFVPCTLTFAPCACGVILSSTSATTPLAHMVVVTGCNLVAFFLQPLAQTLLASVVYIYIYRRARCTSRTCEARSGSPQLI